MNLKILFILTFCLFGTTYSVQHGDRITVEWVYSDEAREIAAVHRYHWLDNNTAILFDVRQPKEERTFLKLDPQKPKRGPRKRTRGVTCPPQMRSNLFWQ